MSEKRQVKLLDVDKAKRVKDEKKRRLNRSKRKANAIRLVFISLIGFLCLRVGYIKVVHGEEYEKQAVMQPTTQDTEQTLSAKRGDILDRTGKSLAMSTSVYTVFVDVHVINEINEASKNKDVIDTTAQTLYDILGYPIEDFNDLFEKDSEGNLVNDTYYHIIAKEVPSDKAKLLEEAGLQGVHLEEVGKRFYPYGNLGAQTIGFIGGDGQSSNWGLENYYNEALTGTDGRYFVSYDENQAVQKVEVEPIQGNTLVTTIDATMQQFCDQLVDKYGQEHNVKNASIIIMKPDTGEIIAMSEYPRFDLNAPGNLSLVTDPTFASTDEALDDSEKGEHIYSMWKNFNISNTFEPGSIFKPVTVAMALEENIITNDDVFYCNGYKTFPDGTRVKCWIYDSTGGGHGKQTVEEALANSCNVAMMEIGEKVGREIFAKYQKDFGYGEKTGIDLPGEEDAHDLVYDADELNEVELATGAFGQGFNSTAIQDIVSISAVINGGYIVEPYIVSDVLDSSGNVIYHREPTITRQVISQETSDMVRRDLQATMEYGTGKNLAIDGYSIGGKTGTAEQVPRGSGKYALSFVGYIPVENPEYIALGVLNEPDDYLTEHTSAVPMMKEVFQKLITYYNIPSDSESSTLSTSETVFAKDYTGSVVDAVNDINAKGYNFEISGSGDYVYRQQPNKDQPIDENSTMFLYVQESEGSDSSQLVEVPDLVGVDLDEAESILTDLGFEVLETSDTVYDASSITNDSVSVDGSLQDEVAEEPSYTVTKQMPKKGISLPKGTQIRLIYK